MPIFVNEEFLGTAGGCGLLPEGGEVETFMVEKTTEMSERQIADLCAGLKIMTNEEADAMADYIEKQITAFIDAYVN